MNTNATIFFVVMGFVVMGFLFFEKVRVKAEVIHWTSKVSEFSPSFGHIGTIRPLVFHIFVRTRYGRKKLRLILPREGKEGIPACAFIGYKMDVMVPLLGCKVEYSKWWTDEKDVSRC